MNTPDFNPLVRSPKFFVRKEDKKYFFEDKENKCWSAQDGERIDALACEVIGKQEACSFLGYREIKVFKMDRDL